MKLYAMLTATLVLGVTLAAPANASGGRDGGERSDRASERAERDRADRTEKADRDAAKREERDARDARRDSERSDKDVFDGKDQDAKDDNDLGGSSGSGDGSVSKADNGNSGSNSGSSNGSGGDENDDDHSGSGSSDSDDDKDDNSGSNSGSSDSDDDDDGDDDSEDKGGERGQLSFDDNGQLYRDRELVVLLNNNSELGRIADMGFNVIETRAMRRDPGLVVRVGFPADMGAHEALDRLRAAIPDAPSAYNHVYTASGETVAPGALLLQPKPSYSGATAGLVAVIDGFSGGTVLHHDVKPFVQKRAGIAHGDNVVSILVNDLVALGYASPGRLLAADVVEQSSGAAPAASIIGLIDALDWAAAEGAQVINISLTGPPNLVLETMVNEIARDGTLIVAAVGNSGPATKPGFPAAYDSVMGITAVDASGAPYIYAARGEQVELSAEAVSISPVSGSETLSGTSFAAPRVSALAATLIHQQTADDVRTRLQRLASDLGAPGRDDVFGYGAVPPPPAPPSLAASEGPQRKSARRE